MKVSPRFKREYFFEDSKVSFALDIEERILFLMVSWSCAKLCYDLSYILSDFDVDFLCPPKVSSQMGHLT